MFKVFSNFLPTQNFIKIIKFSRCFSTSLIMDTNSYRNLYSYRSHMCGELDEKDVGKQVTLCGWVHTLRGEHFFLLRDYAGLVQILLSNGTVTACGKKISDIKQESVLRIEGIVQNRPEGQENVRMSTGSIEIVPKTIDILNISKPLPFQVKNYSNKLEPIRLKHRYLDIRTQRMQHNLRLRSKLISDIRKFLEKYFFIEVETPMLFRPTLGGAQEFIVPASFAPGKVFSLPQSPQQLKQLLMVGGIDRYYQVARCFRDEHCMADRQLEFTQIDIEMSFVDQNNIIQLTEKLIKSVWPDQLSSDPFPVLSYDDAITLYGSDKPDIRFDMTITDLIEFVPDNLQKLLKADYMKGIKVENAQTSFTPNFKEKLSNNLKKAYHDHGTYVFLHFSDNAWKVTPTKWRFISDCLDVNKVVHAFSLQPNDIAILTWGDFLRVHVTLGHLRNCVAHLFHERKIKPLSNDHKFLWVVDFPLFEKDSDSDILKANHHPFTAPHLDDIDKLESDPLSVKSLCYDLVLNGQEVGGGSIRIHNADLQRRILKILQLDTQNLFYLLEALEIGAPPHGGIALGIDRILAILCNADTIRDVIAFPKQSSGNDLMADIPCKINNKSVD